MTLHDRLRAAILARQERAQAATGGPWRAFGTYVATEANACTCAGGFEWVPHEPHCGYEPIHGGGLAEHDATFIAAEDPAFVLRQCARDLAILDRHQRDDCNDPNCPEIVELADAYAISTEEEHRPWLTSRTSCASWSTQSTA